MAGDPESPALLAFAPLIVGAIIAAVAGYYWRRGRELRANGITTQARIVSKTTAFGPLGDCNQFTLQFSDSAGNARMIEVIERQMRSEGLSEGAVVAITYDPARPDRAEFGYRWAKKFEGWVVVVFGLFGAGMVVYGLSLILGVA